MGLPPLLFISHFLPNYDGVGPNIRAASHVEALSAFFDVHVLHVEFYRMGLDDLRFVHDRAKSFTRVPARTGEVPIEGLVARRWPDMPFAAIHTFRLLSARITLGLLAQMHGARPQLHLDLDDDECLREERTVALMAAAGDTSRASHQMAELTRLRTLERMLAPRFDTLSFAGDPATAKDRFPTKRLIHLPNVVRVPESAGLLASARDGYDLLFSGSLNYFPNTDGIEFFCREVLPLIRARVDRPVYLAIVGANPDRRVLELASLHGVRVIPNVPHIDPFFQDVDLCVVPLRAGSGTRLKILDAFSRRRAVVSTRIGAEDLGVTDGHQLLLADDAVGLAEACCRALTDSALRDRLVQRAFDWLETHGTVDSLRPVMASIYAPTLARTDTTPESTTGQS